MKLGMSPSVQPTVEERPAQPSRGAYVAPDHAKRPSGRERVLEAIVYNPGINAQGISEKTGVPVGSVYVYAATLTKKGHIQRRHKNGRHRYYPSGSAPVVAPPPAPEPTPEPEPPTAPVPAQATPVPSSSKTLVGSLAKDFYWETGSNDLREFIKWFEGQS